MRGILSIIFTVVLLQVNAQGINFQGVARSANGTILASSNISLRLSIISKNVDATPEYVESKTVVTNAQGIFSIVVGDASGTSVTGNFKNIVWSDGPKFLKVEMDPSGGTNFINMGATQLQYVPYSFYSFSVDASGVKGILPIEKGGTGVGSLAELKSTLNIGSNMDTTSLSRRIDTKFAKSDILQLENGGTGVKNLNDLKTLLNIANPVIQFGSNTGDSLYLKSDVDIFKTFDGGWNRYIFLPAPTNSNNLLANRLNKTILITSGSSFSFTIKKDNTNLNSDLVVKTNEFATFKYNGSKWLLLDGKNAITNNSTDTLNNTFLGSNTLQANTTGNGNSAFGDSSLASNTTGLNNTAVGYQTLSSNNSGSWNTAIGLESLKNNTIGLLNTAIGTWSLHDNTQGNGNTAIGVNALPLNTTGEHNIAIGNTSASANRTGSFNILIGADANLSSSNLTNAIAIGKGATVSNSNSIQLGNTDITDIKTSGMLTAAGYKIPGGTSAQYLRADGSVATSITSGVPYTGASQAVDLGAYDLTVNGVTAGFGGGQIATNTAFGIGVLNSNTTGSLNSAFGSGVLNLNTTGSSNTGFGIGVLNLNTTGSLNSAFGSGALFFNTTGSSNSAFGSDALGSNRTGMNNIALGDNALKSNIGNSHSVAIGYNAMLNADNRTTGIPTGNTAIGYESLKGSSTPANNRGIGNTAIGYQSLTNNINGFNNNALGQISLKNNTTGSSNVAIGSLTLMDNTTGNMNTAIGVDALQYNTTGNMNTGIGYQTLFTNQANIGSVAIGYRAMMNSDNRTTGRITANTAIGYEALRGGASIDNTGQNNTAVGYQSLISNTSGYSLTAIGESSLKSNTTGDRNVAIGSGTLINNTIGKYNIAIGSDAMQSNILGDRNTSVGMKTLRLSTGNSNTAVGFYSLEQNTTGQYNTAIGDESLSLNTSGNYNSALGYLALKNNTTYSNSTGIGYNAQVTASNQIQLGNTNVTEVKTSGAITAKKYNSTITNDLNFSTGTNNVDLSLSNIFTINLGGNVTLTFSNATPGTYILKLVQDGSGSRTATFPVSNWRWAGGEVPSLSLSSGKIDIVTIIFDGTTYFATIVNGF